MVRNSSTAVYKMLPGVREFKPRIIKKELNFDLILLLLLFNKMHVYVNHCFSENKCLMVICSPVKKYDIMPLFISTILLQGFSLIFYVVNMYKSWKFELGSFFHELLEHSLGSLFTCHSGLRK